MNMNRNIQWKLPELEVHPTATLAAYLPSLDGPLFPWPRPPLCPHLGRCYPASALWSLSWRFWIFTLHTKFKMVIITKSQATNTLCWRTWEKVYLAQLPTQWYLFTLDGFVLNNRLCRATFFRTTFLVGFVYWSVALQLRISEYFL